MTCPQCSGPMVKAKATSFGEEYDFCRTCKKELAEMQPKTTITLSGFMNRVIEGMTVWTKKSNSPFIVAAIDYHLGNITIRDATGLIGTYPHNMFHLEDPNPPKTAMSVSPANPFLAAMKAFRPHQIGVLGFCHNCGSTALEINNKLAPASCGAGVGSSPSGAQP